jgi:putative transposase
MDLILGIGLERIKPGHLEQSGRHERMHLTRKREATKPAPPNFLQQQARFEAFVARGTSATRSARSISVRYLPARRCGVSQVGEHIWLVSFMDYDLGFFDDETCRLEPIENPFWRKVYPCARNELSPM